MAPEHETDALFEGMAKDESSAFQLQQWVEGVPLHNPITDVCCPDFSCCTSSHRMLPPKIREIFAKAYNAQASEVLQSILLIGVGFSLADLTEKEQDNSADLIALLESLALKFNWRIDYE